MIDLPETLFPHLFLPPSFPRQAERAGNDALLMLPVPRVPHGALFLHFLPLYPSPSHSLSTARSKTTTCKPPPSFDFPPPLPSFLPSNKTIGKKKRGKKMETFKCKSPQTPHAQVPTPLHKSPLFPSPLSPPTPLPFPPSRKLPSALCLSSCKSNLKKKEKKEKERRALQCKPLHADPQSFPIPVRMLWGGGFQEVRRKFDRRKLQEGKRKVKKFQSP